MPSDKPRFTFRTEDYILKKLSYVAQKEKRSSSQQLEKVLCDFLEKYEKENGEIPITEKQCFNIHCNNKGTSI